MSSRWLNVVVYCMKSCSQDHKPRISSHPVLFFGPDGSGADVFGADGVRGRYPSSTSSKVIVGTEEGT